jgi:hypothetical protein
LIGTTTAGTASPFLSPISAGPVLLPQGPAVRDPYAGTAGLPWWRGQLHTHTARSFDGDPNVPPARRAAQYQEAGFNFVVLTDHDHVSTAGPADVAAVVAADGSSPGAAGRPFLALPGVESTDWRAHLGVWLVGPQAGAAVQEPPVVAAAAPPDERIAAWAEAGALVCANHPNHPSATPTAEQVASWAGGGLPFRFVEVFNTLATQSPDGVSYNAEVWRRAITAAGPERTVWGVASDDSHGLDVGQGWIAVAAPDLSPAALREALLAGRFYASNGPVFSALGADVAAKGLVAAAPGVATIRFIGDDGVVRQQVAGDAGVHRPDGSARWIRFEASDAAGRTAWSQPFWIDA